jgi:hypothetical protein
MTPIIKPPIAANSPVSFRIITGETVIARYIGRSDTHLIVTKPVVANPVQNEQGYGIYYTPLFPTVDEDDTYRIPSSAILIEAMRPRDELVAAYVKMTSGLDLAPSSPLL